MLKVELIAIVATVRHKYLAYRVDSQSEAVECTVLRLPAYHSELNPIEQIWGKSGMKCHEAKKTFKIKDMKVLLEGAVKNVASDNWKAAERHVEKLEKQLWENDTRSDKEVAIIIISISDTDENENSEVCDSSGDEEVSGMSQPPISGVLPMTTQEA